MKFKVLIFLSLSTVFFAACSGLSPNESAGLSKTQTAPAARQEMQEKLPEASADGKTAGTSERTAGKDQVSLDAADKSQAAKPIERKIIRNAELSLESDEPEVAQQKITAIAEGKGGFVIESVQRGTDVTSVKRDTVTMSIRIPSEKFNESLDEIRKTASRVVVETIKGQDVTEEFIDIEARLKAKKALEEQFLEIMKRSNSVADALNVQREISNVRSEIEQIEGRKRFLENQSSLSTVNVTVQTPKAISGSSKGFFYRLTDSIGNGLDVALSFIFLFITAIIAILPFLLLVALPGFLVIRYFLRKASSKIRSVSKGPESIVKEELSDE